MKKLIIKKLFITKDWIIIHFGKNPRKGGSPPNENRFIIKKNFNIEFLEKEIVCFKKKILNLLRKRIILKEIRV